MSSSRIVTLVLVIVAGAAVATAPAPASQNKDAAAVRELLKQRVDTLRQIETHLKARFRVGTATTLGLLAASRDRLSAELALADSRDARLEILQKQVDVARSEERIWQQRQTVGRGNVLDLLRVRASRLEYEIDLAREKSRS